MEFKPFPKIERIGNIYMEITQKIHGTNAQVYIYKDETGTLQLKAGSRTRWITPEDDNYGFATHVYKHREEFIEKLGAGQHFGEWAGPGINSGEGLTEKTFVLFNYWKFPPGRPLPPQTIIVPLLYKGKIDIAEMDKALAKLKIEGSMLAPGFMRPEGVVVLVGDIRYKKVFDAEETQWKKGDPVYRAAKQDGPDMSHLLQPIRLEKLLSRDETYVRNFPTSLKLICDAYFQDLIDEGQIENTENAVKLARRSLGGSLFQFIKENIKLNG